MIVKQTPSNICEAISFISMCGQFIAVSYIFFL